jgi:hypothetical protein
MCLFGYTDGSVLAPLRGCRLLKLTYSYLAQEIHLHYCTLHKFLVVTNEI